MVADTPKEGGTTAAAQQDSILMTLQDTLTALRKPFKRDLWKFVEQCVQNREEVLIVGDFNEVFGSEVDGISKMLAADFNLIHLMKTRHLAPLPATYSRGRNCLDYGLATSRRFSDALLPCGYEAFNDKFTTDHRSYSEYYFDFDTDPLFGNAAQVLSSRPSEFLNPTTSNKRPNIKISNMTICSVAMHLNARNSSPCQEIVTSSQNDWIRTCLRQVLTLNKR